MEDGIEMKNGNDEDGNKPASSDDVDCNEGETEVNEGCDKDGTIDGKTWDDCNEPSTIGDCNGNVSEPQPVADAVVRDGDAE
ncbi:hypothetical protein V6N11_043107 [Hibiscus sabdariffa]|uniref:Uncharacterized protein n=1 Tax=Hibiscus sabdariffa TaxID=183260 RepID=A0ABR2QY73_9ROSI